MKKLILAAVILISANHLNAQNTNVIDVTKKTVTTIKDSEGAKEIVKEQGLKATQEIELNDADSKTLNKDVKETPYQVETSTITTVVNPDGSTRTVGIDRSGVYESNGTKFKLTLDAAGYIVSTESDVKIGVMRTTSSNSFIFRGKNYVSVGYFDINGNLIVESHDEKSDRISITNYKKVL